jgi:3-hydroxy-3-methylglutaryl CoA synthase
LKFCDRDKKKERETIDAIVKKGNLREKILERRVKNYKNYEVSAKYANHENVKNNYTKKEKRTTRIATLLLV